MAGLADRPHIDGLVRQRPQLGYGQADGDAADAGEREASLDADDEDPLRDRGGDVEGVDNLVARTQLDDAADERGIELG